MSWLALHQFCNQYVYDMMELEYKEIRGEKLCTSEISSTHVLEFIENQLITHLSIFFNYGDRSSRN